MNYRRDHLDTIDNIDSLISDLTCESRLEECYVNEPFTTTLTFNATISPERLQARLYVNRPDGSEENVVMTLVSRGNNDYFNYVATLASDSVGSIEYYGVVSACGKSLATNTARITVLPPKDEQWQHKPVYEQVAEGIWVGSARAAFEAEKLGFDCVLNVADQFNFSMSKEKYKYIPLMDWGTNAIANDKIQEAVNWLTAQVSCGKKTLINCRAGIGRSGSIAIAYLYAHNPRLNYHQVVHLARHGNGGRIPGKSNIYPHVGLKESLEELYPGSDRPATTEIKHVWLENYRLCETVSKKKNEKIIVRVKVDYWGEIKPFVFVHSNITDGHKEDMPMIRKEENLYEAVLTPEYAGRFWLTVRASNYMATTPWHDAEKWLGGMGDNLYLDIQD